MKATALGDTEDQGVALLGGGGMLGRGSGDSLGARRAAATAAQRSLFARIVAAPIAPIFIPVATNTEGGGGEGEGEGESEGGA